MTIWLYADPHFGHNNIIEYSHRPFKNVDEMAEIIISNFNSVVKSSDTAICLGDFCLDKSPLKYLSRMNGFHHLILGNHDNEKQMRDIFISVRDVGFIKFNKQKVWCSHYPHARWPSCHYGTCHAFGHTHNQFGGIGRSRDVGLDATKFFPTNFEDFISSLISIPVIGAKEHHN